MTPPTRAELDRALDAKDRQAIYDAHRQQPWQRLTSVGVLASIIFTAGGLYFTARTWETGQQSQLTDRYTKAVEQLGSTSMDVRLGGIYALERLANDSPRDHQTIYSVLAAFIREHGPKPGKTAPETPSTDIQAALTAIGRRDSARDFEGEGWCLDLAGIRAAGAYLTGADFCAVVLYGAELNNIRAMEINLTNANLNQANLVDAHLAEAQLAATGLILADLSLADISRANLTGADMRGTILKNAYLNDATLIGADLDQADLTGADLTGADLRGVTGQPEAEIRKAAAHTDNAKFGPMPKGVTLPTSTGRPKQPCITS